MLSKQAGPPLREAQPLIANLVESGCRYEKQSVAMKKKRHHYIPKSYLKFFCDNSGHVLVYRKDDPCKAISLSPDNIGFHKYYYSQPKSDGGEDHNSLEDCFSQIEDKWSGIVD